MPFARTHRHHPDEPGAHPFERDHDRVLYSSAFRRLSGVTQVVAANETALLHNRLTHSMKVGQVGRLISRRLEERARDDPKQARAIEQFGGLDQWVVSTAGLAHDLGHPPFGHIAEETLQEILSPTPNLRRSRRTGVDLEVGRAVPQGYHLPDSFEGNAQSFRIVTTLSFRSTPRHLEATQPTRTPRGLNLTKASLAGISKYPWRKNERPPGISLGKMKWGAYESESDLLTMAMDGIRVRSHGDAVEARSIEAQCMDWADDITYAIHDLEDFYRAGFIPLEQLALDTPEYGRFIAYCAAVVGTDSAAAVSTADVLKSTMRQLREWYFPQNAYRGSRQDREAIHYMASNLIDGFVASLSVSEEGVVTAPKETQLQIEVLKRLTWYYVIDRPSLGSAQRGQAALIRDLFVWLVAWVHDEYEGSGVHPVVVARQSEDVTADLPARLVDYLDITFASDTYRDERLSIARAVADYISSLTEPQALELHRRLGGSAAGSMLDAWFQV